MSVVAFFAFPAVAKHEAVKKAREAGYELTVERAEIRLWEVRLHGVRVSGQRADMTAGIVRVTYDSRLRTGTITAEKADITIKEGEQKAGSGGRRSDMAILDSTVRMTRAGAKVSAKVRSARASADGRIWADADVTVESGDSLAEIRGLRAAGVDPEKSTDMTAESVRVEVGEKLEEAGKARTSERGARGERKASLRVKKFSVVGTMSGTADNMLASVELHPWGVEIHAEAERMMASGNEADLAMLDVTRRDEGAEWLEFRASAEAVETGNRRLSKGDFSVRKLQVRGALVKTAGGMSLTRSDVRIGEAQAGVEAYLGNSAATLKMEMPETGCQALLESLPRELVPVLRPENGATRLSGTMAWKLEVTVDLPARKKPDVSIWLRNKCVVEEVPDELNVARLQRPFRHDEYTSGGKTTTEVVGPGTASWTPLGAMSPLMPMAVMAMEDPSFMAHRGILIEAIENSMEQNITAGKFVRGGSTISMQLAKNLWLAREKTLSRKIQEAFLTTYLEQRMTKQKMMELYLNVVEFGPDLYGIGPAARRYFAKDPGNLTLSQSLFLASLLPSPKSAGFEEGKKVSQGRLDLLRKVMKMMLDRGTIDRTQYEQGLRETPVFGDPSAVGETDAGPRVPGGIDPSEWR